MSGIEELHLLMDEGGYVYEIASSPPLVLEKAKSQIENPSNAMNNGRTLNPTQYFDSLLL